MISVSANNESFPCSDVTTERYTDLGSVDCSCYPVTDSSSSSSSSPSSFHQVTGSLFIIPPSSLSWSLSWTISQSKEKKWKKINRKEFTIICDEEHSFIQKALRHYTGSKFLRPPHPMKLLAGYRKAEMSSFFEVSLMLQMSSFPPTFHIWGQHL